ncbi:hypothetical protein LTS10_003838 [Elasticomyces elasticus]|nr:hypothetical protein LTS10_003838 [Elasticomyces elasticus]
MATKPPSPRTIAWKRLCGKELTPAELVYEERKREIAKQQRLNREERDAASRRDNIRNGRASCSFGHHPQGVHQCEVMQMDRQHDELMKKLGESEAKIERLGACRCSNGGSFGNDSVLASKNEKSERWS